MRDHRASSRFTQWAYIQECHGLVLSMECVTIEVGTSFVRKRENFLKTESADLTHVPKHVQDTYLCFWRPLSLWYANCAECCVVVHLHTEKQSQSNERLNRHLSFFWCGMRANLTMLCWWGRFSLFMSILLENVFGIVSKHFLIYLGSIGSVYGHEILFRSFVYPIFTFQPVL